jgi:hypothetical protein
MKSAALITALALLLSGCLEPKITKRYETRLLTTATDPAYGPSLTVFATDVPVATPQTTLAGLSERGQAALIRELSAKATNADDLIRLLGTPIPGPKVLERTLDLTVFERRVVLSVENRSTSPGDRLDRVAMILKPSSPGEFVSWNQFVTRYQTTNLGTIEFTQNRELAVGLNAGPPTAGVTGSAKEVQNLKETLNLSQRFVDVTGTLTRWKHVVEGGAFGIDLTGNTIVDFTVRVGNDADHEELDTFSFPKLFDDKDAPLGANAIRFDRQTVKFVTPISCQEIRASSQLLSTLRRIDANDATIMEGDDKARYERINFDTWNIHACAQRASARQRLVVGEFTGRAGPPQPTTPPN